MWAKTQVPRKRLTPKTKLANHIFLQLQLIETFTPFLLLILAGFLLSYTSLTVGDFEFEFGLSTGIFILTIFILWPHSISFDHLIFLRDTTCYCCDFAYRYRQEALTSNYCRDPGGNAGPWCYTTSSTRWQYCNIPKCDLCMLYGYCGQGL